MADRDKGARAPNSAAVIAQLLGTEGYSGFVHNQVSRYWRRRIMRREAEKKLAQLQEDFSEIMADLTAGDRLIVGKFIALRAQMSFDTGIRIGLTAFAHGTKNGTPFDKEAL